MSADKSLVRRGRRQANVSVRIAWISFGALPCRKKKSWRQLASRCRWNRARLWHASELVSFLVWLRTYQPPGTLSRVRIQIQWGSQRCLRGLSKYHLCLEGYRFRSACGNRLETSDEVCESLQASNGMLLQLCHAVGMLLQLCHTIGMLLQLCHAAGILLQLCHAVGMLLQLCHAAGMLLQLCHAVGMLLQLCHAVGMLLQLCHAHFLTHPFQFIFHDHPATL